MNSKYNFSFGMNENAYMEGFTLHYLGQILPVFFLIIAPSCFFNNNAREESVPTNNGTLYSSATRLQVCNI